MWEQLQGQIPSQTNQSTAGSDKHCVQWPPLIDYVNEREGESHRLGELAYLTVKVKRNTEHAHANIPLPLSVK